MATSVPTLDLHGVPMPALGLGTYKLTGREGRAAVADALAQGYRHLDTAVMYANEAEVGEAVHASGVPRDEVFLTTKVLPEDLAPERVRASAEGSLRRLGMDHVDLLLVHWPNPDVPLEATLEAFTRLQEEGKTRRIGVSNFPARLFARACALAPVACNQVEYHVFLDQSRVLDAAQAHGAVVTAYRPINKGGLDGEPVLREIAEAHGATPAQVALRWLLQQDGVAAIPKAASRANRATNLGALGFTLTDEEMERLHTLSARGARAVNPSWPYTPDWEDG